LIKSPLGAKQATKPPVAEFYLTKVIDYYMKSHSYMFKEAKWLIRKKTKGFFPCAPKRLKN
jgi:hypothetical protein